MRKFDDIVNSFVSKQEQDCIIIETEKVLDQEESKMAKIGASGIKGKEEVKVEHEPCFGGYLEEDPTCTECDEYEECQEKAKELLDGLSAVSEKNSEEEEVTKDAFDPKEVILSGEERIDVLCDLTKEQLLAVAEYNDIDVSHIDVKKKDTENDLVLEIDSQMAERESDEQYEEEEGDKSGTVVDVDDEVEEKEDDTKVAEIVEDEDLVEEKAKEEVDPRSDDEDSEGENEQKVQDVTIEYVGLVLSGSVLNLISAQKRFLSDFGDVCLLKKARNELNIIVDDLLGKGSNVEEIPTKVEVQEQVKVVLGEKVEPSKPELESAEKEAEPVVEEEKVVEKEKVESKSNEGIPDCVIDIADNAGYTVKIKKTGFAVKDGGKNVLTGLNTKDGVMIIFNKGDVAQLEGSEAVAKPPWAPYPFVWADNPKLSSLIETHFEKE